MRTQLLKTLSFCCLGLALIGRPDRAAAQLLFGPNGLAPQTFNAAPPATQWSTLSIGANSPSAITTTAELDAAVQTNTAASVSAALSTNSTVLPPLGNTAQWSSSGLYLQSRANGNNYSLLEATLRNNAGSNVSSIVVTYDLGALVAAGSGIVEEIPGLRAYYSLTGAAGSWVQIPGLDSPNASFSGRLSATLNLGSWPANSSLFLLWADDNGSVGSTAPNHEGGYTIDNFTVSYREPSIFTQPQSQSVSPGLPATLTVIAGGGLPLTYQWRLNSNNIPNATNTTYFINNAQLSDQGFYQVVISNPFGSIVSSNAFLSVSCGAPVTITTQPASQDLNNGATLSLSVTVTGSTPITYQWYRGGTPIPNATNTFYQKAGALASDSGLYHVVVSNCGGPVVSSSATVSVSAAPYVLMGLTNQTWRYNQSGTLPSPTWQSPAYSDAAWSSGRALLAVEDNAALTPLVNTTLSLTDGGGARVVTYYFRTTFVLTNDPETTTIISSNYFDDGAIVYINGVQAFRYNMPGGTVGNGTLASAANPAGEGVFIVSNLPPALLVQGTNLIAVEVHQNSLTSSDIVFGMSLLAVSPPPTLLAISDEPLDVTVQESRPATFSVGVSGTGANYQWFRESNGIVTAISGAIGSTFTIPVTTASDAGNYFVAATNFVNRVYSRFARLTVTPDTNAPALVDADGTGSPTTVLVSFSERISPATATNTANYRITNTLNGAVLQINSAVVTNGTNVILGTGVRTAGQNYILVANAIQDIRTNTIVTNSSIPIAAQVVTLIGMNSAYRYYDPLPFIGEDPNLGTAWKEPGYNDSGAPFADGSSIFYFGPDDGNAPGAVGSHLDQTDSYITYFRSRFNVGFSPGNARLSLIHALDDGAVFYLNGNDVLRANLPDGPIPYRDPILYNTPAVTPVGAIFRTDPIPLPGSLVVTGQNVLAVSLHQAALLDLEKAYGAQLDARVLSYVTGAVMITSGVEDRTVLENRPLILEATSVAGTRFQWQQNSNNIAGATGSSYTIQQVPLSLNGARFRVIVSNSTSTATSTNGTLRVIADTNAPVVLSGTLTTSNSTVQVIFSEALSAATATNIANYRITNSSGQLQTITGATLRNGTNVTLTVGTIAGGGLRLVINGVRDIAAAANSVSNAVLRLGVEDLVVSRDATWKYLLTVTNQNIQTNYYRTTFDDSSWAGPSPGVLHVEEGGLPGGWVKGTQVSPTMFQEISPGVSNYLNTVYFRKTVSTPFVGGTVTLRGRVLYDDGVVIYVNGVELARYTMPAGAITAATQASGGHESGDSVPTFEIVVTNWVAGNNVIAAEVHQSGATSSDLVFGLELSVSVPSRVLTGVPVQIVSQPQSRSVGTNANVAFSVNLIGDPTLTYQWSKDGVDIPYANSSTLVISGVRGTDAGGYRVRITNSFSSALSQVATLTVTNSGVSNNCQPVSWANSFRLGTNDLQQTFVSPNTIVLKWTNPVTNTCNSNATVVLQRALSLGNAYPVSSTLWTNIHTNVFGAATVTNTVPGAGQAYYRLRVQ